MALTTSAHILADMIEVDVSTAEKVINHIEFNVFVGSQLGDEGKGGVADKCVEKCISEGKKVFVLSPNGGSGAGHTGYKQQPDGTWRKYNTNIFPASIVGADMVFLGNQKLLNLMSLSKELVRITDQSNGPALISLTDLKRKLRISDHALITLLPAIIQEVVNECSKSKTSGGKVGTTLQGISTTLSQFMIKAPIEVLTYRHLTPSQRSNQLDEYYNVICCAELLEQYISHVRATRVQKLMVEFNGMNVEIFAETPKDLLQTIKMIDIQYLNNFFSTFEDCIVEKDFLFQETIKSARNDIRTAFVIEGVQANGLSSFNGPLRSTTSSDLDLDTLLKTSCGMHACLTTYASCGVKTNIVNVCKLIQSSVGNHTNPTVITDYADILKDEFVNCDQGCECILDNNSCGELLQEFPELGQYAKLAGIVLNSMKEKKKPDGTSYTTKDFWDDKTKMFSPGKLLSFYYGEFGTTTGRVRELSWLDIMRIQHNRLVYGKKQLYAYTRLDAYNLFKKFKICVGYQSKSTKKIMKYDDVGIDFKTLNFSDLEPIYEEIDTWKGTFDFESCKSIEDFPPEAKQILKLVEKYLGKTYSCNLSARKTVFV